MKIIFKALLFIFLLACSTSAPTKKLNDKDAQLLINRSRVFMTYMRDITDDRTQNKSIRFMSANDEFYENTMKAIEPLKELTGEKKEYTTFLSKVKKALKLEDPQAFRKEMQVWSLGLGKGLENEANGVLSGN